VSPIEFSGEDILIDGVPSKQLVSALKAAGLSDESVTALLGQAISRAPALGTAAAQRFTFQTELAPAAPECAADFARGFFHPDFFDGLTVVQAGQTPEELGFNVRFHAIEDDLDAVATNLSRLSNCLAELRSEVSSLVGELEDKLTEIDAKLATKGEKEKEGKDTKETKEKEEEKEGKDKEKEGKDKEKEGKDHGDKLSQLEKIASVEKARQENLQPGGAEPPADDATERTFVQPQDRPAVGVRAMKQPDGEDTGDGDS
jgi:hypothetical protein